MKQTVTSKYEPKSKNVTWIDMSTGSPVLKNFINGMWKPTGGSGCGAGSSNPTEADATKVWQVTPILKETKTESFDILHEYTNTFHYDENLIPDATNLDKFTAGSKCILTVTGDAEYDGNIYEGFVNPSMAVSFNETPFEFYITTDGLVFNYGGSDDELTLSLSVEQETPIYDYNWAPGVKIPIPTAEDEGKILVVTKSAGENSKIIVPEQTVTTDQSGDAILQDTNNELFVEGTTIYVILSALGMDFNVSGVVETNGQDSFCELNDLESGSVLGTLCLYTNPTEFILEGGPLNVELTISAVVPDFDYNYELVDAPAEKVLTLNDWASTSNISYLIDVDGNRLNEGDDYIITYFDNPSQYPFIRSIRRISINRNNNVNIDCDKIIVNSLYNKIWTKIPDYIRSSKKEVGWIWVDSNGNSLECIIQVSGGGPYN